MSPGNESVIGFDQNYKSFAAAALGLLGLFIFFRVMTIVSLAVQDTKFGETTGDTRNQNIPQQQGREKTLVVVQGKITDGL